MQKLTRIFQFCRKRKFHCLICFFKGKGQKYATIETLFISLYLKRKMLNSIPLHYHVIYFDNDLSAFKLIDKNAGSIIQSFEEVHRITYFREK